MQRRGNKNLAALLGPLSKQDVYVWNGSATLLKLRHGHFIGDLIKDGAKYGVSAAKALLHPCQHHPDHCIGIRRPSILTGWETIGTERCYGVVRQGYDDNRSCYSMYDIHVHQDQLPIAI